MVERTLSLGRKATALIPASYFMQPLPQTMHVTLLWQSGHASS